MIAIAAAVALSLAGGADVWSASAVPATGPEVYVLNAQADSVIRPSHPLFDGTILVPRASAHDRFAVQNGSGGIAYLRVALRSVEVPDDDLRRSLSIRVSTAQGSGPVVPLDPPGSCVPLLAPQEVRPGAIVDIDAALAMGDLTGTSGQAEPIGFSILVVLDADPAGAGCGSGGPGGGGGTTPPVAAERHAASPLADTGSDLLAASWIAAALAAAGAAAAVASRAHAARRRSTRHDSRDEG